MGSILGYKWNTLQAARNAQNAANAQMGIPVSPNAVTKQWFVVDHDLDGGFYFFEGDLSPIFGQPTVIEISENIEYDV